MTDHSKESRFNQRFLGLICGIVILTSLVLRTVSGFPNDIRDRFQEIGAFLVFPAMLLLLFYEIVLYMARWKRKQESFHERRIVRCFAYLMVSWSVLASVTLLGVSPHDTTGMIFGVVTGMAFAAVNFFLAAIGISSAVVVRSPPVYYALYVLSILISLGIWILGLR